jgi:hypothetical protein
MDIQAAVASKRTRLGFAVVALLVFVVLLAYGTAVDGRVGFALVRVHIGVVLVVSVVFAVGVGNLGSDIHWVAALGYSVAGVLIGYGGLAALDLVPAFSLLGTLGDLALLIAFAAYFYQREFVDSDGDAGDPESEADAES